MEEQAYNLIGILEHDIKSRESLFNTLTDSYLFAESIAYVAALQHSLDLIKKTFSM